MRTRLQSPPTRPRTCASMTSISPAATISSRAGPLQRRMEIVLADGKIGRGQAESRSAASRRCRRERSCAAACVPSGAAPARHRPRRGAPPTSPSRMLRYCFVTSTARSALLDDRAGTRRRSGRSSAANSSRRRFRNRAAARARSPGPRPPRWCRDAESRRGRRSSRATACRRAAGPRNRPATRKRVDHPPFGDRRMDVDAVHADHHQIGRERLAVDLIGPLAVQRVTDHGAELASGRRDRRRGQSLRRR